MELTDRTYASIPWSQNRTDKYFMIFFHIWNRTGRTYICIPTLRIELKELLFHSHIWKRTQRTYICIPIFIIELIELLLLFQQMIGTYIYIPTKTRNFQSPTLPVQIWIQVCSTWFIQ